MFVLVEYGNILEILGVYGTVETAMITVKKVYPLAKFNPEDNSIATGYFGKQIPWPDELIASCYQLHLRLLPVSKNVARKLQKLSKGLSSLAGYKYKVYSLKHYSPLGNASEEISLRSVWYLKTKAECTKFFKQIGSGWTIKRREQDSAITYLSDDSTGSEVYILLPMDEDDLDPLELYKFAKGM